MLEGSHGQRVEVWLRRSDERTGVSRVTSSHFFFAVAAPNLYVPPVFAIESTILIQATLSSFCFLSRCGCVMSSLSSSSCTYFLSRATCIYISMANVHGIWTTHVSSSPFRRTNSLPPRLGQGPVTTTKCRLGHLAAKRFANVPVCATVSLHLQQQLIVLLALRLLSIIQRRHKAALEVALGGNFALVAPLDSLHGTPTKKVHRGARPGVEHCLLVMEILSG